MSISHYRVICLRQGYIRQYSLFRLILYHLLPQDSHVFKNFKEV